MSKTKWVLDPTHSELGFKIKHLMITNVTGSFNIFTVNAETDNEDFTKATISFTADTASVTTGNEQRDGHLKSADFFDVENHPELTFTGASFNKVDDENYQLKGILTIKGVSKEITLDVEFGGINKDPWGNEKAVINLQGKINRKDWGLNWNAALETGGVLVGEDVTFDIEVQLAKAV